MSDEIQIETSSKADNPFDATPMIESTQKVFDEMLAAANVQAVYGEPIKNDDTWVVPSAEIIGLVGYGGGRGGGKNGTENIGGGGGVGGWGRVFSRPVAAIVITPESVRVQPIVDVTKIALAAFTAMGFMVAMVARMSNKNARRALED